jgi:dihydrofolate synthase / folylpolyglutamate synthase
MNYKETLDYMFAQLPMYQRVGAAAYKKDLTNTLALCEHLGNPHHKFPCIHVGGTNGKGSVSHFLAAFCQSLGLKTGLYVSPHYKNFRERIKINGQYIPQRAVVDFIATNKTALEAIQPSFFEMTVGMAFDYFAQQRVDIAIIEVGLGGRLDSTNVITPELSVITNISYDHMNMLGDTLPQIAYEKAGIIKPGVPVVIGETHPESAPVFIQKALECHTEIIFADAHFEVVENAKNINSSNWLTSSYDIFKDKEKFLESVEIGAGGPYQNRNLTTALQAWTIFQNGRPDWDKVRFALAHLRELTRFQGRWQLIGQNPTILCDSAHNEAGIRTVFYNIDPFLPKEAQLHLVTGFVNDKDIDKILALFPTYARYYFAKANIPRGLDAEMLRQQAAKQGLQGRAYSSVRNALKAAKRAAKTNDLILVIGSIFVVGEVI